MKYKLYGETKEELTPTQQVLYNRGIKTLADQEKWLNAGKECLNSWRDFGPIMEQALYKLKQHIDNDDNAFIIIDQDQDGFSSSSILINFLDQAEPDWSSKHLSWGHHIGKQHGITDMMDNILHRNCQLVISPDGGSNDLYCHQNLLDCGIDVICLDHHNYDIDKIESESPAIVVNVQGCEYPNKALTGAGVVFRFIEGYNELFCNNKIDTDYWLDIAAAGDAADMADYREPEIRALVRLGFKELHNPFLKALAKKNSFILEKRNGLNYLSAAFGIFPFVNAMTRSGKMNEKEIVFDAMLDRNADKMIASTKRGHKGELVPFAEEAVLVADRVKRRQTDLQNQAVDYLQQKMKDENLNDNAVLTFFCEENAIPVSLAGLAANAYQSKYQKPVLVLNYHPDKESYIGSMRNYSLSPLDNFKAVLEETGEVEWVAGQ